MSHGRGRCVLHFITIQHANGSPASDVNGAGFVIASTRFLDCRTVAFSAFSDNTTTLDPSFRPSRPCRKLTIRLVPMSRKSKIGRPPFCVPRSAANASTPHYFVVSGARFGRRPCIRGFPNTSFAIYGFSRTCNLGSPLLRDLNLTFLPRCAVPPGPLLPHARKIALQIFNHGGTQICWPH